MGGWVGVRFWILCPIYHTGSSEGEREMGGGGGGGGGGKKTCQIDSYSYIPYCHQYISEES